MSDSWTPAPDTAVLASISHPRRSKGADGLSRANEKSHGHVRLWPSNRRPPPSSVATFPRKTVSSSATYIEPPAPLILDTPPPCAAVQLTMDEERISTTPSPSRWIPPPLHPPMQAPELMWTSTSLAVSTVRVTRATGGGRRDTASSSDRASERIERGASESLKMSTEAREPSRESERFWHVMSTRLNFERVLRPRRGSMSKEPGCAVPIKTIPFGTNRLGVTCCSVDSIEPRVVTQYPFPVRIASLLRPRRTVSR
eukprot:1233308-Rhodomonas_salina.3